jgi:hypothetical protein
MDKNALKIVPERSNVSAAYVASYDNGKERVI